MYEMKMKQVEGNNILTLKNANIDILNYLI
jgi:hypothetical protein